MKNVLIFIVAIVLAAAAGYLTQNYLSSTQQVERQQNNTVIGTQRPEFAMLDIDGSIRNIKDWDGKVVLLNFWATWCPPCKKEVPVFIELQQEYGKQGLQIVGVAVDNIEDVSAFAMEMNINYPLMVGEQESIDIARRYGNIFGALPFTVVINRNGIISSTFAGEMTRSRTLKSLQDAGLNI